MHAAELSFTLLYSSSLPFQVGITGQNRNHWERKRLGYRQKDANGRPHIPNFFCPECKTYRDVTRQACTCGLKATDEAFALANLSPADYERRRARVLAECEQLANEQIERARRANGGGR